jgi:hypothetical protein
MAKRIYPKSLIILFGIALLFSVFSHIKVSAANTPLDTPSQSSILEVFKVSDYGYDCANEKGTFATGLLPTITKSLEKITSSFDMQTFLYERDCGSPEQAEDYLKETVGGGAMFFINRANTALLDQRPASGIDFLDQKIYAISNPGIVRAAEPELYYPGAGQALLQPIQSFWGWSFNLVLALMVVIIIIIAFAIISNAKLPGNVTVTLQTAIPNIALAMVLIPLSYAISGLFIDFITLGTNAAHNFVFGAGAPGREVYEARDPVLPDNPTEEEREADRGYYPDDPRINVWNMWRRLNITDALQAGVTTATADSINNFAPLVLIANFLNVIFSETGDGTVAYWFAAIINLIVSILMIWMGVKIFVKLLGKYVTLILLPIFSPFIFATVAIPGSGTKSLINYLKTLGSASLFYIVTYLMFLLTLVLTSPEFHAKIPDFRSGAFIPPLLGIEGLGVIQGISVSGFSSAEFSLIGFFFTVVGGAVYFSISGVLDQIDSAMGTKFGLPAFIKTPLDGIKESWKITTRAAPAFAAKATQITAGGARNIASTGMNAGFNLQRGWDRARGIADDDPRSAAYKRKDRNVKRRQELLTELDSTNNPIRRAQIQSELAKLDAKESLQGKEYSTKTEEGKDRGIKVTIDYGNLDGTQGAKSFTKNELATIAEARNRGDATYRVRIADLVIEPENTSFPTSTKTSVELSGVVKLANNVDVYGGSNPANISRYLSSRGINQEGTDPKNPRLDYFPTWNDTADWPLGPLVNTDTSGPTRTGTSPNFPLESRLVLKGDNMRDSEGGTKIKIQLDILIVMSEFDLLFGQLQTLERAIAFPVVQKTPGILNTGLMSDKRAVGIGPYTSKPFRVSVRLANNL